MKAGVDDLDRAPMAQAWFDGGNEGGEMVNLALAVVAEVSFSKLSDAVWDEDGRPRIFKHLLDIQVVGDPLQNVPQRLQK